MMRRTVRNLQFRKSNMAAAAILKNRKIAISPPLFSDFNEIWQGDWVTQFGPRDGLVRYKFEI